MLIMCNPCENERELKLKSIDLVGFIFVFVELKFQLVYYLINTKIDFVNLSGFEKFKY